MRSRVPPFALLLVVGLFVLPFAAHATGIPNFGPIIPSGDQTCPLGFGALIMVVNNLITFVLTLAIVFVAPIMIAYAGFLYVVNAVNPSGISKAKSILWNTILGIIIALAAWMIVDALMAALYNPSAFEATWSSIVTGGDICLTQAGTAPGSGLNSGTGGTGSGITTSSGGGSGTSGSGNNAQCSSSNPACSVQALESAGFGQTQANVMSCIAMTENSGNATGCNSVNACGTFQIIVTVNQLNGPDCAQFNNGNPTINCPAICHGNNGVAVTTAACQPCVQAANNAACNAESAYSLYQQSSGYGPWTTSSDNKNSGGCIQQYGGSS
jgi:hypothetical protein